MAAHAVSSVSADEESSVLDAVSRALWLTARESFSGLWHTRLPFSRRRTTPPLHSCTARTIDNNNSYGCPHPYTIDKLGGSLCESQRGQRSIFVYSSFCSHMLTMHTPKHPNGARTMIAGVHAPPNSNRRALTATRPLPQTGPAVPAQSRHRTSRSEEPEHPP